MKVAHKGTVATLAVVCLLIVLRGEARQPSPRIDSNQKQAKSFELESVNRIKGSSFNLEQNEIEDRIIVREPYKSLLQTTARFALAQTKISDHINIEAVMDLLNNAGVMLSRPSNLIKAVELIGVAIASFLTVTFFFPGTYKFVDAVLQDPVRTLDLDKYMSNGMSEKSVIGILSLKADKLLARIGLHDTSCMKRSLCYIGEILKCVFPATAETVIKFASDNFSNTSYRENKYMSAFLSGFVNQNCTKINSEESNLNNCLRNFFNSLLLTNRNSKQASKYQTIQVGRA